MEKKKHLVEITYIESGNQEVITLNTDDLAWSMNQYQRNRLPFTWEILDDKDCCGDNCCDDSIDDREWVMEETEHGNRYTLKDVEMIQQGIKNNKSDNS
tara:strand:- start:213 stop:509 length:297 start_codon:yes stop_codon:yes gene_type:complete